MNFLGETLTVLGRTRPRNILFLILSFFGINFFFIKSIFFEKLKMVESRVTDLCFKRNSQTSLCTRGFIMKTVKQSSNDI